MYNSCALSTAGGGGLGVGKYWDDSRIRWHITTAWYFAAHKYIITVAATFEFRLTARLQYPPQPIRERWETNEEQKLTITSQNFMPCTQSFSCTIIIIAVLWVPACDTLISGAVSPISTQYKKYFFNIVCWSRLSVIRIICHPRWNTFALRTGPSVAKRICIYNIRNKIEHFLFLNCDPFRKNAVQMDSVSRSMGPQ